MQFLITHLPIALVLASCATMAQSATDNSFELTVQNHKFTPAPLTVPADTKIKITLHNQDQTTAEFTSDDIKGGKLVAGGKTASFFIGPLKAGTYEFYDEYHEDASKTQLIAK